MIKLKKYKGTEQNWIRFAILVLPISLIILSMIFLDRLSNSINISLCIFIIAIIFIGSLIKYKNDKFHQKEPIDKKYSIIEITLIVFSVYLMISNYAIYGFWDLIFVIMGPSLIIGFIFLFSFVLALFIPNTIARIILIPVIFIYPIQFLTMTTSWMIYGVLLSSICLVETIYALLKNLRNDRHRIEELNTKITLIFLKIFLPILLISFVLFAFIGYDKMAIFKNDIEINKIHSLILWIPFIVFIFLQFFEIDLKIIGIVFLMGNILTTFLLKDFKTLGEYNVTNFLIADLEIVHRNSFELFGIIALKALIASLVVSAIDFVYTEWGVFNQRFQLLNKLDNNINRFKKIDGYEIKFFILKISFLKSLYLVEDKMKLDLFLNPTVKYNQEWLYKHVFAISLKKSFSFLLFFNAFILSIIIAYNFKLNKLDIFYYSFAGMWAIYINIVFNILLIFWDKAQLKYFGTWINKKEKNDYIRLNKIIKHKNKKFSKKSSHSSIKNKVDKN